MKLVMKLALIISATLLLGKGAVAAQPTTTDMKFAIMRNGEQIGTHSIALHQAGAETTVNSATSVIVKILFVTAYHYEHTSTEHWIDGHLVSLNSTTDDNGTKHKLDQDCSSRWMGSRRKSTRTLFRPVFGIRQFFGNRSL
jgi:hypothetical protein